MSEAGRERTEKLDLSLQSLRIIQAIAATGSITGASKALGVSQPAISQHLQRTESKLGMPLVLRAGRTTKLTEAGRILSEYAAEALRTLDTAFEEMNKLADLRAGNIRIVGFPSASSTIVPALLNTLRTRRPGMVITYVEEEPPEALEMLQNGESDLGFVFSYPDEGDDLARADRSRLQIAGLYSDRLHLVLPRDHPLAGEPVIDMIALEEDQWIAGCPKCRGNLLNFCHRVGFEPDIAFATDNTMAVIGMVASGLGVALVPRLALGTAALPDSVAVRTVSPSIHRIISVVTSSELRGVPAVESALAAVAGLDGSPWKLGPVAAA